MVSFVVCLFSSLRPSHSQVARHITGFVYHSPFRESNPLKKVEPSNRGRESSQTCTNILKNITWYRILYCIDSNQIFHSDRTTILFVGGPNKNNKSKMAYGRHLKIEKAPSLGNGLTDRHEIWHTPSRITPPNSSNSSYNFEFFKNPSGRTAAILNIENRRISIITV